MFCEKAVLKNYVKLTGKHLCWSLSFAKVALHITLRILRKFLRIPVV